jgi:hypothetical protein
MSTLAILTALNHQLPKRRFRDLARSNDPASEPGKSSGPAGYRDQVYVSCSDPFGRNRYQSWRELEKEYDALCGYELEEAGIALFGRALCSLVVRVNRRVPVEIRNLSRFDLLQGLYDQPQGDYERNR